MLFLWYPKCTTCQKAKAFLDERDVSYEARDIKLENPTAEELRGWWEKSGMPLKKFFNTSGLQYKALGLKDKLPEMSELGLDWHNDVTISSMCTVFAESEVVSLIARSTAPADIIHGLNKSVAGKTAALARRTGGVAPFMMTGGVARNRGVVKELETALKAPVEVSEYSQLCGSLGAALFALEKMGVKL